MAAPVCRSLRQWWTRTSDRELLSAQQQLLESLVRSPMGRIADDAQQHQHTSSQSKRHGLNVVEFHANHSSSTNDTTLPTVILLHGFGSGLGFFYANIDPILQSGRVAKVMLVDWLGMGGSDRPHCRRPIRGLSDCTTALCQSRYTPPQVVDFFLEPLHHLLQDEQQASSTAATTSQRPKNNPLWLVGHSLGGYLAARYALRHVTNIGPAAADTTSSSATNSTTPAINLEKVVLASPVGFPAKPANLLSSRQLPTALRLMDALWSANVTPQQLVRVMGATRGRRAVRRVLAGRIPQLNEANSDNVLDLLADYLFHITVAHPSGEFAMNSLLEPGVAPDMAGVFAREPLEPLFQQLYAERDDGTNSKNPTAATTMEWKVLFGDHDWMRPNGEPSARQAMGYVDDRNAATASKVAVIPNAGHHLYLDNANEFVRHILE